MERAMRRIGIFGSGVILLAVAGCNVTVDNKSIDNQADAVAAGAANLAEDAGNLAERAGDKVENSADALGNKIDRATDNMHVNVDLHGDGNRSDGNASSGNSH